MHMRGAPATMQTHAYYKNVIGEVIKELKISIEKCLEIGIKKDRIIVDPGIGFAKTVEQNFALINHLDDLNILHCPILLGTSRKSFIGRFVTHRCSQPSDGDGSDGRGGCYARGTYCPRP